MDRSLINFSSEVSAALGKNKPLVALESTVIAHGLPRPQNLETARRLEQIVRESGAVPATIAILNGQFTAGLSDEQICCIAGSEAIRKIGIRDLPIAVAQKWNGATTVASTSWIAQRAGIKVFATGGSAVFIGFHADISGDCPPRDHTNRCCCSGAKIVWIAATVMVGNHGIQSLDINVMKCRLSIRAAAAYL